MRTPDFVTDFMEEAPVASEDALKRLVALADKQIEQALKVEEVEVELAKAKEAFKKTSEVLIPSLMQEIGMKSFTLNSGDVLEVEEAVQASISAANQAEAFKWLRGSGYGGIIKNTMSLSFGSGEDDNAAAVIALLQGAGFAPEQKEAVHPATLKSFVREQLAALGDEEPDNQEPAIREDDGFIDDDEPAADAKVPFPKEAFGVYVYEVAKIKKPKVKKAAKKK